MNGPLPDASALMPSRHGLLARLSVVGAFLAVETLLISGLIQSPALDALSGAAKSTHDIQHYLFRFIIAYAASFAILLYLRGSASAGAGAGARAASAAFRKAPARMHWLLVHVLLLMAFASLSAVLYRQHDSFWPLAIGWHVCGFAAAAALMAAVAPLPVWLQAVRRTRGLLLVALLPAAGALLAFKASQLLWAPASEMTFSLVRLLLLRLVPSLQADAATHTLSSDHFAVQVTEACSGLEGVGLMLAFCAAWLWYFRREYIFPRALIVVPLALLGIFLLNAVRIAALLLIGDAGYARIATVGFHSQAGWIAFNAAAFAVALGARRSAWLTRDAHAAGAHAAGAHAAGAGRNATAAYLMPLLAILAAGMLAHALSAGFDALYPLRLICAVIALWVYRRSYRALDWGFTWRGVLLGGGVFAVWALFAQQVSTPALPPDELLQLAPPLRAAWIICRACAALITVPIAEELAFRGYLMRRLMRADFETISLREVSWPAIALSALAFGATHGSFWLPGIAAGLGYGMLAMKTGKIGESVVAHATTNALLAVQVLLFGQWQLW